MYYSDLDLCDYHNGAYSYLNWEVPLLTVGWIEDGQSFPNGSCSNEVTEKINLLTDQAKPIFFNFRGLHNCSICKNTLEHSNVNLFIPGKKEIFICSASINHYINKHNYLPPLQFINALLNCPDIGSPEYKLTLKIINNHIEAPIKFKSEL